MHSSGFLSCFDRANAEGPNVPRRTSDPPTPSLHQPLIAVQELNPDVCGSSHQWLGHGMLLESRQIRVLKFGVVRNA